MTPTNLPDLYSRVVAKRPELAVDELVYDDCWEVTGNGCLCVVVKTETAAALILAKWVEALPKHNGLMRGMDDPEGNPTWYVGGVVVICKPNPLEALAAFWLEAP
jgi:hypothetical protein